MKTVLWLGIACVLLASSGCGYLLQRTSVKRDFSARFGCQAKSVSRAGGGYHVEGCGQSAEYVCLADPPDTTSATYDPSSDARSEALGTLLFAGLLAGTNEHCHLAYAQQLATTPMPVASSAPAPVRRVAPSSGELVLKTRILVQGGYLSARAKPNEHPGHVLLIVHATARLSESLCKAEIFHDGVAVPVVEQARVDPYEVRLLLPIAALRGAERAVRFAGSVCGLEFELDLSGRATLGQFALQFQEELLRQQALTAEAGVTSDSP